MESNYSFNLETCQLRFYTISKNILQRRQNTSYSVEDDLLYCYTYDYSVRKNRRSAIDRSFLNSSVNNKTEKILSDRLKEIDLQLNRMMNVFDYY